MKARSPYEREIKSISPYPQILNFSDSVICNAERQIKQTVFD